MANRRYARTSRVNELLREILADELERLDDRRLALVTVSGVEVDPGLEHAVVFYDAPGETEDEEVQVALMSSRVRLQRAVASQARLRQTPRLTFRADHGIRGGERVDTILRGLCEPGEGTEVDDGGDEGESSADRS